MASDDNRAGGSTQGGRPVYLVDGARTPFIAARGEPGPFTPVDLAVQCGRPLLLRQPAAAKAIDQVVLGCVNVLAEEANPARIAALRLGLGAAMPAFTVQINCGSGMQSIDTGRQLIENGRADLVLAGGAEALSHSPLLIPPPGVRWLAALRKAHSLRKGAQVLTGFRPSLLKPAFERPYGQVTAGNASQVTDGACWTLLASEATVERLRLEPLARIRDSAWRALDPSIMGLAPVLCSTALMQRHGLTMDAVDLWEINEAFAAQVLACLKVWDDESLCRDLLGSEGAVTAPAPERLNVDGGAISLGHPVGTSGNRIVLHLARALERLGKPRGIATECIGGGQGGAMLIERP